jgi:hypothetical protein
MISIVICSINESYLEQVRKSIALTVGVEYELLVWNNLHENKGLCEVYNMMAEKARFDILCFAHEDIIFETNDWGQVLATSFAQDPALGVIGVAGSKYKSRSFSGWFTGVTAFDRARIVHRHTYGDRLIDLNPAKNSSTERVVCVDGVFICCTRQIWQQVRFDEKRVPGFHFYDVDFSLRASKLCSVAVTFGILMTHLTRGGDFVDNWIRAAFDYHELYQNDLPLTVLPGEHKEAEKAIRKTWLDLLKHYDISWRNKMKWIRKQQLHKDPSLYYGIVKFLFYKPLGIRRLHLGRNKHE